MTAEILGNISPLLQATQAYDRGEKEDKFKFSLRLNFKNDLIVTN